MSDARKPKLLVADDDPLNRKLLETLLRSEGYEVVCASSGAAALEEIGAGMPDLLLLDLMMPRMDGFEVVRRIRADPATADLAILMVTSLDDQGARTRLATAGVTEILTKPLDRWELKARVEKLLQAHQGSIHESQ